MTCAGWRLVRTIDRSASWPTWAPRPLVMRAGAASGAAARMLETQPSLRDDGRVACSRAGGLGVGRVRPVRRAFERAPGLREEDVVERGRVELEVRHLQAR